MPLDQLLAALEREAARTSEQLLAEARAEAARLTSGTEREVARRRDLAVAEAERGQRIVVERAVSDATRAARRETLTAREQLLTRIFRAVRMALPAATMGRAYRDTLPTRVADALASMEGSEHAVIGCSASLREYLDPIVAAHPGLSLESSPEAISGFRLATVDGTIEVDDTLESRLDTMQPVLARLALHHLEDVA